MNQVTDSLCNRCKFGHCLRQTEQQSITDFGENPDLEDMFDENIEMSHGNQHEVSATYIVSICNYNNVAPLKLGTVHECNQFKSIEEIK